MNVQRWIPIVLLPVFLSGCFDNPTTPALDSDGHDDDDHADPTSALIVNLELSSSHVHILSELTFTATVTDHDGQVVTDFDTLRVERKAEEDDTWRSIDLELQGTSYVGTYTFASSGAYEIRVAGRRPHDEAAVLMYEMHEMLHAARAHGELAAYRVEFESFPGHIHTGEVAAVRFWIMEPEKNENDVRPPITGLTALQVHCLTESGAEELHAVTEIEPGVYEADHEFLEAGHFHAGLHMDMNGETHEAAFDLNIAHGH